MTENIAKEKDATDELAWPASRSHGISKEKEIGPRITCWSNATLAYILLDLRYLTEAPRFAYNAQTSIPPFFRGNIRIAIWKFCPGQGLLKRTAALLHKHPRFKGRTGTPPLEAISTLVVLQDLFSGVHPMLERRDLR
jgi:hypothetical protein